MNKRWTRKLIILVLLSFTGQSLAASLLSCCNESTQSHPSEHEQAHSSMMQDMLMEIEPHMHNDMQLKHEEMRLSLNCEHDCQYKYCGASAIALFESSTKDFDRLHPTKLTQLSLEYPSAVKVIPFRPPIIT